MLPQWVLRAVAGTAVGVLRVRCVTNRLLRLRYPPYLLSEVSRRVPPRAAPRPSQSALALWLLHGSGVSQQAAAALQGTTWKMLPSQQAVPFTIDGCAAGAPGNQPSEGAPVLLAPVNALNVSLLRLRQEPLSKRCACARWRASVQVASAPAATGASSSSRHGKIPC